LIAELVYKKGGLILKNLIVASKKNKKINILEFGRELGKENWSLGICVALYFYFFSGSIIA
jgi:chemotaxis methyl-accepting protein methylase